MLRLSEAEVRNFGTRGYVIIRSIIPPAALAAASSAIDNLIDKQPPPENHVGPHFYWLSTLDGGPLSALFYDTPVRSLAQSLVEPGEIEIAFNQVQVALNVPPFSHRPGAHHDGYQEGEAVPGTFTMLAGVLMSEQKIRTLETYGCGQERIERMRHSFESEGRKHSLNIKATRRFHCRSPAKF